MMIKRQSSSVHSYQQLTGSKDWEGSNTPLLPQNCNTYPKFGKGEFDRKTWKCTDTILKDLFVLSILEQPMFSDFWVNFG